MRHVLMTSTALIAFLNWKRVSLDWTFFDPVESDAWKWELE